MRSGYKHYDCMLLYNQSKKALTHVKQSNYHRQNEVFSIPVNEGENIASYVDIATVAVFHIKYTDVPLEERLANRGIVTTRKTLNI